jgi:hypothetical protein
MEIYDALRHTTTDASHLAAHTPFLRTEKPISPCTPCLLNPLLSLLQPQQSRITLAPLVLCADQRSYNTAPHFTQRLLKGLDLRGLAVELGPVDLLLVSLIEKPMGSEDRCRLT